MAAKRISRSACIVLIGLLSISAGNKYGYAEEGPDATSVSETASPAKSSPGITDANAGAGSGGPSLEEMNNKLNDAKEVISIR